MKGANQVVKEYVLRAISDDYEDLKTVLEDTTGWSTERGIPVDRQAVLRALEELICEGYAQAYFLSASLPGKPEPATYSVDRPDDFWFYVTPKGKQLALRLQEEWR